MGLKIITELFDQNDKSNEEAYSVTAFVHALFQVPKYIKLMDLENSADFKILEIHPQFQSALVSERHQSKRLYFLPGRYASGAQGLVFVGSW